jgi:hypothetical protein
MLMTASRDTATTAPIMVLASRPTITQLSAPVRWTCSVLLSTGGRGGEPFAVAQLLAGRLSHRRD